MKIDATALADLIEQATETKTIHVPSSDYYARRGDFDEDTITFINGARLVDLLREMTEATQGK